MSLAANTRRHPPAPGMHDDGLMAIRRMRVGEYDIAYTDSDSAVTNSSAASPTFLLVHGIGMGTSYFAELREALEPSGRVVAIDLPGFGDSPEPEPDNDLSMAELGRVLAEFAEALALEHPVLVGHSMGTQVVAEAARARPDLFDELVLIAPTVNRHERSIGLQAWRMVQDLYNDDPRVLALGIQNYLKAGPRWFAKKLRSMMAHEIEATLPHIQAHTLVIRGLRDPVSPHDWATEVTALVPNARLAEIEGRGHETMVKDGVCAADLIVKHLPLA
ncbi:alpha/beta fold hydrolase [Leifsonia sp. A12D58]|uniref:alpha/beta fold hydrolase n=1 Tax=Leifsonia sp. A12D58 TaxID=3397674 RepID=UPI0039DF8299